MTTSGLAAAASSTERSRAAVWPLLVVGLAFFLRVYLLSSVPFGWHPDEATKALLARDLLAGEDRPVFFSAFTGRDALYVYLEAATFALLGEGMFAGRLLSALIGVLTVACTYAVGRELFNRRVGLFAAALLGVSLWHLIASRNGYRAVIQPLVQLPVFWFLFRGLRLPPSGWRASGRLLAAGLFLGLTQYTYTAARAFPILILAVVLWMWMIAPSAVGRRWRPIAAMFLVAAAVALPLAGHFARNPTDFYGRATQISVSAPAWAGGDPWGRLWQSVRETAGMFTSWGDPNYRFNLAGRPVFGLAEGTLFYCGLLLALWLTFRRQQSHRAAHAALLLWLGIMLLPMTLSAESLPYYQRAIGVLPAVYFFPALSVDAAIAWVERHKLFLDSARAVGILVLLWCLLSLALEVHQAYSVEWHQAERNDSDRRVAMVYAAEYLRRSEPAGELYLSSEYSEHPTLAFLAPGQYEGIHWFDARQSLPLAPSEATYLLLLENAPQPALLSRVPRLQRIDTRLDRFGRPVLEVYRWREGVPPAPSDVSPVIWSWEVTFEPGDPQGLRHQIPPPVNLGNVLEYVGNDRSSDVLQPGGTLELVLYWRLLQRPERHYSIFAHLLDSQSHIAAEYDANRYPTSFWQENGGETLLSYFPLSTEAGIEAGEYQLEIGVYHQPTGERLQVYDGEETVADRLLLRPVKVH